MASFAALDGSVALDCQMQEERECYLIQLMQAELLATAVALGKGTGAGCKGHLASGGQFHNSLCFCRALESVLSFEGALEKDKLL